MGGTQNKYFYSPYSNETFYTKAIEYKEYFTPITFEKMTKSLEDIQHCIAKTEFMLIG
jgi:hypothetical protein